LALCSSELASVCAAAMDTNPLAAPLLAYAGQASAQDFAPDGTHISIDQLGIQVPMIPGDISLCGYLPPEVMENLAPRYKSWIFLNKATDPNFYPEELALASVNHVEVLPIPGPPLPMPTDEQVESALNAMDRLPRPLMLQCSSGNRAGVLLLLWLVKKHGYSVETAQKLARDCDLKFWTRCSNCGPMREWLLARLDRMPSGETPCDGEILTAVESFVFSQLFDPESCTFTYIVGCESTKEAILIDPVREQKDRDMTMLSELGLELRYVVNTHAHADHVTAGGRIRAEKPEVRTVISKASGARADVLAEAGDKVVFGNFHIEAIATPGHTKGCLSWLLQASGKGMVFTGDALLIGGCGRTDFQQGDAGELYDSVHSKLFTLPDDTLVYPGHDYHGHSVSTIAEEKRSNPRLTKSRDQFVKMMAELELPLPAKMDIAVRANMLCGI